MADTDIDARPTLKTIAKLSGLAVPTVSRALNDAPDIGEFPDTVPPTGDANARGSITVTVPPTGE